MYKYFTDHILTGCTFFSDTGVEYTAMVVTSEFSSASEAEEAARNEVVKLSTEQQNDAP